MYNSIIWRQSDSSIVGESIFKACKDIWVLTTLRKKSLIPALEFREQRIEHPKNFQLSPWDVVWEVFDHSSGIKGQCEIWRLLKVNNVKSLNELMYGAIYSGESTIIFGGNVNYKKIKLFLENEIELATKSRNKCFVIEESFSSIEQFSSYSSFIVVYGFLTYYDDTNFLIYSLDINFLNEVMSIAIQLGEKRLDDDTSTLKFNKSYGETCVFYADIRKVLENREKSR